LTPQTVKRLLIVGYSGETHVGAHLYGAAQEIGLQAELLNASASIGSSYLLTRLNWHLRDHRPPYLNAFSQAVVRKCEEFRPDLLLVTGITPPTAEALHAAKSLGIVCANFLTDDPWNPVQSSQWFFKALRAYDFVFSPRSSNLAQLAQLGSNTSYLPFAYNPTIHFPEAPPPDAAEKFACDILFYGGADHDRVSYIEGLIKAQLNVHLYGQYWERFPLTRPAAKGMANARTLRWAITGSKVTLCLVRKANRDGHVMRTFEAPAMGACMLAEDTPEHRTILGEDTVYFNSLHDMIEKTQWLVHSDTERNHLAQQTRQHILGNGNTYHHRLMAIVEHVQTYGSN
jgi:spore maturation protein CgeB